MAQVVDGQQFGRFQIVSRLGRGGMASVYRAYEHSLDRTVALKVLPEDLLAQPGFAERFEREARVIAMLEHPNIVPLYSIGIDEGQPWMALRLIRGGHLGERMDCGRLDREAGLDYLAKIADALDFAHSHGIVHRDLKPQNVLVGERGECYIADFGIASLLEGTTRLTQTGAALGTPQYMAPEQAKGESVGPPADVYALGIIVYQWQTGLLPFDADTPYAVMFKHVSAPVPMEPLDCLPERARQVIARALAKSPGDRWQTATEFVLALRAGLDEHASGSVPSAVVPPTAPLASDPAPTSTAAAHTPATSGLPADDATRPESANRGMRSRRLFPALAAIVLLAGGVWAAFERLQNGDMTPGLAPQAEAERIRAIQRDLNALGYRVAENGETDARTLEVIRQFERHHRLAVTGVPDDVLAKAVREEIGRRDEAAWAEAIQVDTEAAYGAYQQAQPHGRYLGEVPRRIDDAKRKEQESARSQDEKRKEAQRQAEATRLAEQERKEIQQQAEATRLAEEKRQSEAATHDAGFVDLGNGTLRDTRSGLIWTQDDNGRNVTWNSAKDHCAGRDMRLPSIDELAAIYDRPGAGTTKCVGTSCKASPLFRLTSYWFWSETLESPSRAWGFGLISGSRGATPVDIGLDTRALCVGRS